MQTTIRLALTGQVPVLAVSEAVEELLGFTRRDFLGLGIRLQDRVHAEDADIADEVFSTELRNRSGVFNIRLRHADGRFRCIKGRYEKEPDRNGRHVILGLVLRDARNITEVGDASLMASFRTLIDHTSDYVYLKNRNHVFLAASQALTILTESSRSAADLLGKTDYDIYPERVADTSATCSSIIARSSG